MMQVSGHHHTFRLLAPVALLQLLQALAQCEQVKRQEDVLSQDSVLLQSRAEAMSRRPSGDLATEVELRSPACVDKDDLCDEYSGQCSLLMVRKMCPRTCRACVEDRLAASHDSAIFQDSILLQSRAETVLKRPSRELATEAESPAPACVDWHGLCEFYQHSGQCISPTVRTLCPHTCRVCVEDRPAASGDSLFSQDSVLLQSLAEVLRRPYHKPAAEVKLPFSARAD